jgi:UDPglucose 6-dehydrogenase
LKVIGVDQDDQRVKAINSGKPPVYEPGLGELIESSRTSLSATTRITEAVRHSSATFVFVPTPYKPGEGYSLDYILPACESLAQALAAKDEFHLVVISSTVMPESTEGILKTRIEKLSGKLCGQQFGLCYNPEFMAIGSVIRDFLNPDFVLIGESDKRSGDQLESIYRKILPKDSKIVRMNLVNAELSKLALNCFVTTKITFSNQLAQMCEFLPGSNVDVVTSTIGLDSRIGPKCLKGGLGFGGPCFPYDNKAMMALADNLGIKAPISGVTDSTNRDEMDRIIEIVKNKLPIGGVTGILGLAYKPGTNVIEGSQGFLIAEELASKGIPVLAYDPEATANAKKQTRFPIQFVESAQDCLNNADVVVIATPWDEFRQIDIRKSNDNRPHVLIDCWRMVDPDKLNKMWTYIAVGVGPTITG